MPALTRQFDQDKVLEAFLFIAKQLHKPTYHSIFKMFYLSDKLHLQKYGRLIYGDSYIAVDYGPVPSAMYNMMKQDAQDMRHSSEMLLNRDCNLDMLAESEIECIQIVIAKYGTQNFDQLADLVCDSAWHATNRNQFIPLKTIVATLPNAAEMACYLHSH